jgi:phosphatidate cytidylyltransferase
MIMRGGSGGLAPALAEPVVDAALMPASPSGRWRDLLPRVLSALVAGPLAVAAIWFGGLAFAAMILLCAAAASIEWAGLCRARLGPVDRVAIPATVLGAVIAGLFGAGPVGLVIVAVSAVLAVRPPAIALRGTRPLRLGAAWLGLAGLSLIVLRSNPGATVGRDGLLFLLAIVVASDTGAYAFGRLFGGKLLAPAISPAKTWAGAVGGLAAAIVTAAVVAFVIDPAASIIRAGATGALLGLAAQAGDLLESHIKRLVGAKDSGRLLPGHGGLLDRIDGLLAASPVAAALAVAAGPGMVWWQ